MAFSCLLFIKMIPAEMRYEMYNTKLLAIVEAFKNWRHYLEGCQYDALVLTDHNNLRRFMDTKNLSSCQVRQAQKLSRYHFCFDYCQDKANEAANALSCYPKRSQEEEEILQAENTRILQHLQSLLTNARASNTLLAHVASLKYVIICGTHVLSDLCQSQETFRQELAAKDPYQASIGGMRPRLVELLIEDCQVWKNRVEKLGRNQENSNRILHHQGLPYVPEIIGTKLIRRHHDDPLVSYFGIKKMRELVTSKYYWETLRHNVEVYVRDCNVYLVSKAVRHKPYRNLQQLPVLTYC